MPDSNFDAWKHKTVLALARCPAPPMTKGEAERHTIYSLALMAITHQYWNGNKYGRGFRYPLNTVQDPTSTGEREGGDYLGHNIAALAVDAEGQIIDFDFNHNEILNSSIEHAESRLLRRLFSLAQVQDSWRVRPPDGGPSYYGSILSGVTLYTTLESCAQCSGIMALAKLGRVVYLQTDPGQYGIGNIMRNMTAGTGLPAPQPIASSAFGFAQHRLLDKAYQKFRVRGAGRPMVTTRDGKPTSDSGTTSITSFLCTAGAQKVFESSERHLRTFRLAAPDYRPPSAVPKPMSNRGALAEARSFVAYAVKQGRRGTPHRA